MIFYLFHSKTDVFGYICYPQKMHKFRYYKVYRSPNCNKSILLHVFFCLMHYIQVIKLLILHNVDDFKILNEFDIVPT